MKRACLLLLPAILLIALAATGCDDESKPIFTRVRATPTCGVVPLSVEVFAAVSGGNESGDPMGGTNNLEVNWKFGDGGTGTTSINYHQYSEPGTYDIIVTAIDPDGNTTSSSIPVTVMADSLVVTAEASNQTPAVGERVKFDMTALGCSINYPTVLGDSVKMTYRWSFMSPTDTTTFTGAGPSFTFETAGHYDVEMAVTYPAQAVVRKEMIPIDVTP